MRMHDFGIEFDVSDDEMFAPIWSRVNEKEKKIVKIKKKLWKTKKRSGDMVARYSFPKFGINSLDGFWENGF